MDPTTDTPRPVLELDNVTVPPPGDPDEALVENVDWRVDEGEHWLVVGSYGAGKSSVLGVAAGMIRPPRGTQRLFGVDLGTLNEAEQMRHRAKVGFVFGGGGRLFRHLTVAENVVLPLRYHGHSQWDGHTEAMLDRLGLNPYLTRFPSELPRRIAQRVALVRALALKPEVLILDEPTGPMGPEEREWWLRLVQGHGGIEMPKTLVVASSEPQSWVGWAQRFAMVKNRMWRILESGAPAGPWLQPVTAP